MEAVKRAIHESVLAAHGPCTLELSNEDMGFSICVHKHPDFVIYIRPDDRQTHYLCHYAHRGDLEACADNSAEVEEWRQQEIFQLRRRIKGGLGLFSRVACAYVHDAVQRMELYKGVGGRGFYKRVKTFEEARQERQLNPRPRPAQSVLPPPVCRRHNGVYRDAEKRKRAQERVTKTEEVCCIFRRVCGFN